MSNQQSYGVIGDIIQASVSFEKMRLAAKNMGISQSTMDTIFDLQNPLSEFKKAQNTIVMRSINERASLAQQQLQALLKQNAQLRLMEAELMAKSKGGSRSDKIKVDDAKQPTAKRASDLEARLVEQNEEADSLCTEINGVDQQIDSKLQSMITVLLSEQSSQTAQFDKMHSALQTALEQNKQGELEKISADDPERASKIAAIEQEYAAKIANLTTHQEHAKALIAETDEQVAKLIADSTIKLSQGQSLNLAVTKLVLMQQPQRLGVALDRANAEEKIAVYEKIYGNSGKLEDMQRNYNSLSTQYKDLAAIIKQEANIDVKQEITPELAEQFSPELQAKYHQLLTLENKRDGAGLELAQLKNFFGTNDKEVIDKIIQEAKLYLNISAEHLDTKSLGESVQAAELGAGKSLQAASVIANEVMELQDKKTDLVDKLQNSLESRAETVLGLSTLRAEQAKEHEQSLSSTPEQPSPEQQNNLQPGNR